MVAAPTQHTSESPDLMSLGYPYIQFQLHGGNRALLSTEHAREVLDVPIQRLTPIPNMPSSVLGLLNWRNLAIWAIDLAHLMDGPRLANTMQQYHMIIVRATETLMALAVPEVDGIARIPLDQIVSPVGVMSSSVVPFLQGCVVQDKEIRLVLDASAIVQSFELGQ